MGSNPILFFSKVKVWRNKVDALVLGTSEIIRIGSSPITSTFFIKVNYSSHRLAWLGQRPFKAQTGVQIPLGSRGIAQLGRALVF